MLHFPEVFPAHKLTKSDTCSPTNPVCLRLDRMSLLAQSKRGVIFFRGFYKELPTSKMDGYSQKQKWQFRVIIIHQRNGPHLAQPGQPNLKVSCR